jgi:hypothetical protein
MKTSEFQKQMIDNINLIIDQANDLTTLSPKQLNWKEAPERWSILECIEHLNRYNDYYIREIENNFKPSSARIEKPLTSTWIGQKSIAMMSPLNRKKQKTFKKMNPANSSLTIDVFKTFIADQQRLKKLLEELMLVDPNSKAVKVEFFKLLKMTIAEALEFLIVHEQRHIIQTFDVKVKIASGSQVGSLVV